MPFVFTFYDDETKFTSYDAKWATKFTSYDDIIYSSHNKLTKILIGKRQKY